MSMSESDNCMDFSGFVICRVGIKGSGVSSSASTSTKRTRPISISD